jgi:uracil-DNA glycosylase family 4
MRWSWIWQCPYDDDGWEAFVASDIGKVILQTVWEQRVDGCTRCSLHRTRKKIVFGAGNPERPRVAFVGLGPGIDEDRVGIPLIGRSGQLFNRMLKAMGLDRRECYVLNVLACRSWDPETRKDVDPTAEQLAACTPVWVSQLKAVRPRVIVALGAVAGNTILGTEGKRVHELRKKWYAWQSIPLQVTYHPAGLLRQEGLKADAWEDLQGVMTRIEEIEQDEASGGGPLFESVR